MAPSRGLVTGVRACSGKLEMQAHGAARAHGPSTALHTVLWDSELSQSPR